MSYSLADFTVKQLALLTFINTTGSHPLADLSSCTYDNIKLHLGKPKQLCQAGQEK